MQYIVQPYIKYDYYWNMCNIQATLQSNII